MRWFILAGLVAAPSLLSAQAADRWDFLGKTKDGASWYYDTASVTRTERGIYVWDMRITGDSVDLTRLLLDCRGRFLLVAGRHNKGTITEYSDTFKSFTADTPVEDIQKHVCAVLSTQIPDRWSFLTEARDGSSWYLDMQSVARTELGTYVW